MSPVIIPSGYTKRYVDGEISFDKQLKDVETAMQHVQGASDVVLCEGTGHCAVGSIVGLNNAKVASILGCDMVLVGTCVYYVHHCWSELLFMGITTYLHSLTVSLFYLDTLSKLYKANGGLGSAVSSESRASTSFLRSFQFTNMYAITLICCCCTV
jgi:AAA domain